MATTLVYPEQRPLPGDLPSRSAFDALSVLPARYRDETFDISVIIPVYNVAPYVEQCLDSVFSQLGVRVQVIIINDGSTDGSLAVVLDYLHRRRAENCIVVDQDNRGLSVVRNVGLLLAVGEFIAYLDSDDFISHQAYGTAVSFARLHSLDLVLFRGLVFDHAQLRSEPFYDSWAWDNLLEERATFVTTCLRTPDLLLLEPNAALRVARRSFALAINLRFPAGLLFEDMPVHVKGLIAARGIGLVNASYYFYRVNRPGKITSTRSKRRFDILSVFDQTLAIARTASLPAEQGAALLYGLLRITWWCGENTLPADRREFFAQACLRFQAIPKAWVKNFKARFKDQPAMRRRLGAFRRGDAAALAAESFGVRRCGREPYLLTGLRQAKSILFKRRNKKKTRKKAAAAGTPTPPCRHQGLLQLGRLSSFLFPAARQNVGGGRGLYNAGADAISRFSFNTLDGQVSADLLDQIIADDLTRIETCFFAHQMLRPAPDGIVLDLGARSGLFAAHLAAMHPRCRVVAVETDTALHAVLSRTARSVPCQNITVLRSLDEALAILADNSAGISLLHIDVSRFGYSVVNDLLTRFKVGHLCGTFDEQNASPIDLYRLSCQHAATFCWYNTSADHRLAGHGTSELEVSIVVPAYKVGAYLPHCLDSLVNQAIRSKEIIVVDDGSPDDSGQIADAWAEKHPEIRVIHKENGGCASARSAGLAAAHGRYVAFIDSDDWVDAGMFEALLTAAALNNADVSQCGFRRVYQDDGTVEVVHESVACEGGQRGFGLVADVKDMMLLEPAIWRCLYRTAYLRAHDIDFAQEIRRYDDLPFRVEVFMHNPRAVVIPEIYYSYRLNRAGQDVDVSDERLFVHFQIFEYLRSKFKDVGRAELERQLKRVQIASHSWALGKLEAQFRRRYWLAAARDIFNTGMLLSRFDILRLVRGMPLARQLSLTAALLVASLQPRRGP